MEVAEFRKKRPPGVVDTLRQKAKQNEKTKNQNPSPSKKTPEKKPPKPPTAHSGRKRSRTRTKTKTKTKKMAGITQTPAEVVSLLGLESYRASGITKAVPRSNANATRQTRDALLVWQFYVEQVGEDATIDDDAYWALWKGVVDVLQAPFKVGGEDSAGGADASGVPAVNIMIATKLPGSPALRMKEHRKTEAFKKSLCGFFERLVRMKELDKAVNAKDTAKVAPMFPHLVVEEVDKVLKASSRYQDAVLTLASNEIDMIKGTPAFDDLCALYDEEYLNKYEAYKKAMTPKPNDSWHWHPTTSEWKADAYVEKLPKEAKEGTGKRRTPAKVLMTMSPSHVEMPPLVLVAHKPLEDLSATDVEVEIA